MILDGLQVGFIGTNCYFFGDDLTKEILIIDPGGDEDQIREKVQTKNLKPIGIIFTHEHFDHTHAAKALKKIFEVPIIYHVNAKIINIKADRKVKEGDQLLAGSETLDVLDAPGHSKGGLILASYKNKLMFVGDSLFAGSIGRTDLGGNYDILMHTIHDKIMFNPKVDDTFQIYSGHSEVTTVGIERQSNPFRHDFL